MNNPRPWKGIDILQNVDATSAAEYKLLVGALGLFGKGVAHAQEVLRPHRRPVERKKVRSHASAEAAQCVDAFPISKIERSHGLRVDPNRSGLAAEKSGHIAVFCQPGQERLTVIRTAVSVNRGAKIPQLNEDEGCDTQTGMQGWNRLVEERQDQASEQYSHEASQEEGIARPWFLKCRSGQPQGDDPRPYRKGSAEGEAQNRGNATPHQR